jgi:hypothetical protein
MVASFLSAQQYLLWAKQPGSMPGPFLSNRQDMRVFLAGVR